jgi:hypothetical protein
MDFYGQTVGGSEVKRISGGIISDYSSILEKTKHMVDIVSYY